MPRVAELPYRSDASTYAEAVIDRPWAVFLDSGRHAPAQPHYDIITADPWCTLVTRGGLTEVRTGGASSTRHDDPFELLARTLGKPRPATGPLPFYGGAIGYFAYDLGRRIERLPTLAIDDGWFPDMAVGLYAWALIVDHAKRRTWLIRPPGAAATARTYCRGKCGGDRCRPFSLHPFPD